MKILKNIVIIGMPGSGKTTISKLLSKKIKTPLVDVDNYIEKTEGESIPDIFLKGEEYFRLIESKAIKKLSLEKGIIISTGGGVVKSASNMEVLKENGVIFFINRPVESISKDVDNNSRPLLKEAPEKLFKLYEERYPLYKKYCDFDIINDRDLSNVVEEIIDILKREDLIK